MIKIFRGAGVVTPSKPPPPTNNFCLFPPPILRCFWKDPLMTPHHPTSSIFHCHPHPIHHPFSPPPKNFDHTPKSNPKLRLEYDLSRKMQFSTDFSQDFTEHPSTIALPWQQWMSHGTGLYSEFKPISI